MPSPPWAPSSSRCPSWSSWSTWRRRRAPARGGRASLMAEAHAVAHDDPNIGVTGLDHRKLGMWAFLGSECMFFGSLIGTYLSYKGKSINGPGPHEILNIPLTSVSAFVLL